MIKKQTVGLTILVLMALLLGACEEIASNNPPSDIQFSILCGSNTFSITYTAGGSLNPALPSYYAAVLASGSQVGIAGTIPPEALVGLPPGMTVPAMPSETAGQRYTVNIPIMGPNGNFANDPWPDETLYSVVILYDFVSGPGIAFYENISCGVQQTAVAAQWWDPGDSRINRDPGALGVIYAVSYGARGMGLHIYKVGGDSHGALWLEITPEMLAAVPQFPSEYTIIARSEDGYIELAKLPTGQYQVNTGPDSEGKIHVVVFDEIRSGSPWFFFTVGIYDNPQ